MKLVFAKDDDHQVTVHQITNGKQKAFSYVDMIRALLDEGPLGLPELDGDFTDPERNSINRMVELINEAIEAEGSESEENEGAEDDYDDEGE